MENREILKEEEAQKIWTKLQDMHDLSVIEELLKDNKIEFTVKDIRYRIRALSLQDKEILHDLRRKKFGNLLQDKDVLMEKDLIRIYKERGTDIDLMDKKLHQLEEEKKVLLMKLGEDISKKLHVSMLESYRIDIENIDSQIKTVITQKNDLLLFSLEAQLAEYITEVMIWLSLDKQGNDKYDRAFHTFEEFKTNIDEEVKTKSAYFTLALHYR